MKIPLLIGIVMMLQVISFKEKQLQNVRVKDAYDQKEKIIKQYFADSGTSYPNFSLFIRAFKKEEILEQLVVD